MNDTKLKAKLLCGLVAAVFVLPFTSEAFTSTQQQAARVSSTLAFYTVSFDLGFASRDLYLPIRAERDYGADHAAIGYTIREDGESVVSNGTALGLVLSDAEIIDGRYVVPAGKRASFTVFVALRTAADTPEADYALKIDHVPFTTDNGELVLTDKLTKSELTGYLTPEVELNEDDTPEYFVQPAPAVRLSSTVTLSLHP